MIASKTERLNVRQAAQIIYGSSQPSESQLQRIQNCLERGALKGACNGRWITTTGFVAEYMASQAYQVDALVDTTSAAGAAQSVINRRQSMPTHSAKHAAELQQTYQEMLGDYFLAIVFRRRRRNASRRFDRAVLGGQIVALVGIVLLFVQVSTRFSTPLPEEHQAVVRWLDQNTEKYRITRWMPMKTDPALEGVLVEVQYHYQNQGGKGIDTQRRFLVDEGGAELFDSGDG